LAITAEGRSLRGRPGERCAAFLHRYADDFVCGFGRAEEAQRFYNELEERLRKFGLELAPDKTRVIPFSRYRQGETSFEFLGFEFRGGVNRKGHAWLKRRTARKKLCNSLKRVTEWCRQNRHRRIREQVQLLNAKLRGYNNYYGVSGNSASLDEFFYHVRRIHHRWLISAVSGTATLGPLTLN
jgi:RNA-directed DNA polymerase